MARSSKPPGPKGIPLVGSLFEYLQSPPEFLRRLAREYGDIVRFTLGTREVFLLNHPNYIKDVLVTRQKCFVKSGVVQRASRVLGNGLVTSEGEFHLKQRRLMQPVFSRKRLTDYGSIMVDHACATRDRWQDGVTLNIRDEMLRLTLGIVGKTLFGSDVESEAPDIGQSLTAAFEHFSRLVLPFAGLLERLPLPSTRRFHTAKRRLDSTVYRLINERREDQTDRGDVLSLLLRVRDSEGDGKGMSDTQIRDEVMTLFLAGHETLSLTLTWTWFLLAKNPSVERQLHDEVDCVVGQRVPRASDYEQLEFTRMVIAESMRLYPPAWMLPRKLIENFPIDKYTLPAGSTVGVSQYVMHRDPRYFAEPDHFDPLRWTESAKAQRAPFTYFPFGGGPRVCIGEQFAWMEATLLLATIAQRWKLRLASSADPQLEALLTLQPRGGIVMRAHERSHESVQQELLVEVPHEAD